MTLKEKVAEIMPERAGEDFYGGVKDCPSSYDFLKGHYGAEVEKCSDTCDCEKCWSQPYIENVKVGTKWWDEEEDITFIITNIDGNNIKYEYDQSFIGSIPKEYLLTHCKCIDDTDINVGNISNNINHLEHYQGKHECIDIMRVLFGDEAVKGFCKCNAFKYRFRAGRKEENTAEQDILKAEFYEDYLFRMEEK